MSYYDSTVASYDTQINNHNQTISECYTKIKQCEDDIEELKRLKIKVDDVDSAVDTAVTATSNKIDNLPSVITNPFAFLKLNYFSTFLDTIRGSDHKRAKGGIESAVTKINNKIKELQNEIESLRSTITQCQNSITSLKQQKGSYITAKENEQRLARQQREAEERARQAASQQASQPKPAASAAKPAAKPAPKPAAKKTTKKEKDLGDVISSFFKKF